jgi:hypothetical protein
MRGLVDRARMLARALSPLLGAGNRLIGRQTFADALASGLSRDRRDPRGRRHHAGGPASARAGRLPRGARCGG